MSKYRIGIVTVLILLATSITFAQSYFSSPSTTPSSQPTATSPSTSPSSQPTATSPSTPPAPMAPSDFQNLVKQQAQKTQNQFNQQATQQLNAHSQQPSTAYKAPTPSAEAGSDNTNSTSNTVADPSASPYNPTDESSPDNAATSTTKAPQKSNGLNIQY